MICVSLSMLFPLCLNNSNSAAFHHASAFRLPYHRVYVWISIGLCVYVSCVYFGRTMSIYIYGNCNSCLFCIFCWWMFCCVHSFQSISLFVVVIVQGEKEKGGRRSFLMYLFTFAMFDSWICVKSPLPRLRSSKLLADGSTGKCCLDHTTHTQINTWEYWTAWFWVSVFYLFMASRFLFFFFAIHVPFIYLLFTHP